MLIGQRAAVIGAKPTWLAAPLGDALLGEIGVMG